jgi:hypothetical protein
MTVRWIPPAIVVLAMCAAAVGQNPIPPIVPSQPAATLALPPSATPFASDLPPLLPTPEASLPHGTPIHAYLPEQGPHGGGCDGDCHECRYAWIGAALFYGKANDTLPTLSGGWVYGIDVDAGYWLNDERTVGATAGFFNADGSLYMSANAGLRFHLYSHERIRLDGLLGYEYLRLEERIAFGSPTVAVNLSTRNYINAGQAGLIADYRFGPYFGELLGTVAIGRNSSRTTLNGVTFSENDNCVIGQFGARVGYQLGEALWGTLGYRINYLSDVERPTRPNSNYLLHGLTIGIEKRF